MEHLWLSALVLSGCAAELSEATELPEESPRCTDPLYGNGTCDAQTSCEAPDIDCFVTFASQAAAQQYYAERQAISPVLSSRPPLPASDRRFARVQALLDDAWEAYRGVHDVGDLAATKIPLVLIDSTEANAFVVPDSEGARIRSPLVIMVHTGLIDLGAPDPQVLGVITHELEHALGMHMIPEVKSGLRRYYVASAGSEPPGFEQSDDAATRTLVEAWLTQAAVVGYLADLELAGWPAGKLGDVFRDRLAKQPVSAACATAAQKVQKLHVDISRARNLVDGSVALPATTPQMIVDLLNEVNAACFAGSTQEPIDVVAAYFQAPRASVVALMPAEAVADVEGKGVVLGFYNWSLAARNRMRRTQATFATTKGVPWSRARFYSTEQAADEATIPTLHAMGLEKDGAAKMYVRLVPGLQAACAPLIAGGGAIPYGENLADDHHGTCWRAGYVTALARADVSPRTRLPLVSRQASVMDAALAPYSH